MTLATPRDGVEVQIKGETVPFSFWPMKKGSRRWALHSQIYASDPWAVIDGVLARLRMDPTYVQAARSFAQQSREYVTAGNSARAYESRPLLYYYGFLNLAKTLLLARGQTEMLGWVYHGLSYDTASAIAPTDSEVAVIDSAGKVNVFPRLVALLQPGYRAAPLTVKSLMAQSVVGHRLWLQAATAGEKFVGVRRVLLMENEDSKELWARIQIDSEAIDRRGLWPKRVVDASLGGDWRAVTDTTDPTSGRPLRQFEMVNSVTYGHRTADSLMEVVAAARPVLWRTFTQARPYRRYYVYLERVATTPVPQVASIYALMFFLGSLARYRPDQFLGLLDGSYGPFVREFLGTQPAQFVYELASELGQQEVSQAAVATLH